MKLRLCTYDNYIKKQNIDIELMIEIYKNRAIINKKEIIFIESFSVCAYFQKPFALRKNFNLFGNVYIDRYESCDEFKIKQYDEETCHDICSCNYLIYK